ncbi:MAG: hypothetical protein Q9160_005679 [Pyrenula sp. 1 TL-2023]
MSSALLIGATGLVGSHILSHLGSSSSISKIDILARRQPKTTSDYEAKVNSVIEKDTNQWTQHIKSLAPAPQIFFSSLGTTRANAGNFDNQYKLEHDLHLELARAAKEAGCKVFVLISSGGANTKATFGYMKMKGEIEQGVKEIGFDHTVILQPGMIGGTRSESRPAEAIVRKIAAFAGHVNANLLKDGWAQDADMIAKAAVNAGVKALNGQAPEGNVWLIKGREIINVARQERQAD